MDHSLHPDHSVQLAPSPKILGYVYPDAALMDKHIVHGLSAQHPVHGSSTYNDTSHSAQQSTGPHHLIRTEA